MKPLSLFVVAVLFAPQPLQSQSFRLADQHVVAHLDLLRMDAERTFALQRIVEQMDSVYGPLEKRGVEAAYYRNLEKADAWTTVRRLDARAVMPPGGKYEQQCASKEQWGTVAIFSYGESSLSRAELERAASVARSGKGVLPIPAEAIELRNRLGAFFRERGYIVGQPVLNRTFDGDEKSGYAIDGYFLPSDEHHYGLFITLYPMWEAAAISLYPCSGVPTGPIVIVHLHPLGIVSYHTQPRVDSLNTVFDARKDQTVKRLSASIESINDAIAEAWRDLELSADEIIADEVRYTNATLVCKRLPEFMEVRRMTEDDDAVTKSIQSDDNRRLEARCAALPGRRPKAPVKAPSAAEHEQCMLSKFPEMKKLGTDYLAAQKNKDSAAMQKIAQQISALMPKVTEACGPTPPR